jgi:FMN phosphatase YigB (HAD superfamily)
VAALRAVLFDLDGTLLDNDLAVFLPRYFQLLSARVSDFIAPQQFIAHLMAATRMMLANDGRATNEAVFAEAFYPLLGRSRPELEPIFLDFYTHDFAALARYTRCRPEAREVVSAAFDLGYDVVIATNPLFPEIAIRQRLEWAGVGDFPYALVTTYENSRACKPNLLYYRQILETIRWEAGECLMVGNEPVDLVAGAIGCPTYLVEDGTPAAEGALQPMAGQPVPPPTYRGRLNELATFLAM